MSCLKAYMVCEGDPEDGACLVFAHTAIEARKVGWPTVSMWGDGNWIDCRAIWLRDAKHLFAEADPEQLSAGIPHVIEAPKRCSTCNLWGGKPNGTGCDICIGTF